jgi:molybdopterin/thiamine biosynthesis adenylyltransferase
MEMTNLSTRALSYQSQMAIRGWGEAGQERLRQSTVFVAGGDGPAAPLISQLALLGIGRIRIGTFVASDDSHRLIAQALNPEVQIEIVPCTLNESSAEELLADHEALDAAVGAADLIIDHVPKITSKFALAACAERKAIPFLFYTAVEFGAATTIIHPPHTARFGELFNLALMAEVSEKAARLSQRPIIPESPHVHFLASGWLVGEALKLLLGLGAPAYQRLFFFLQRGDPDLAKNLAYFGFTAWMSDYLRATLAEQGFDLANPWRGRYIEELVVPPPAQGATR